MDDRVLLATRASDVAALAPMARATDRWVAVTPVAMEELDRRGLPFTIDADVCNADELNDIGRGNFARAEALADYYDQLILRTCPVVGDYTRQPVRGHFTRVKILLDAITARLHILERLRGEGVSRFCAIRDETPIQKTDMDLFYQSESVLYQDLLELLAAQDGVQVDWLPRVSRSASRRRRPALWASARNLARRVVEQLNDWRIVTPRPHRLLTLGTGYDLREILDAYKQLGIEGWWLNLSRPEIRRVPDFRRSHLPWKPLSQELRDAIERLSLPETGETEERLCRAGRICYAPLIRRALQHYVQHEVPAVMELRTFLEACHRQQRFDAMLSPSGPATIRMRTVFDTCQRLDIPIMVVQHGIYGHADNPVTNYYEFGFDGTFLAWGSGIEAHYGSTKRGAVRFVPVGSPTLDRLVDKRSQRMGRGAARVMYIITDLRGATTYFPSGQPLLDTASYRLQRAVLQVLERYQDRYEICLKVPPWMGENRLARNPIESWLRSRGSRIRVETRPLVRVIRNVQLCFIDFPSTTLLQCLATTARIIVWTNSPYLPLLPQARALLARRATCCRTLEEFCRSIETSLETGITPSPVVDDEFLKVFGTFKHDGQSLARILTWMERQGWNEAPIEPDVPTPLAEELA